MKAFLLLSISICCALNPTRAQSYSDVGGVSVLTNGPLSVLNFQIVAQSDNKAAAGIRAYLTVPGTNFEMLSAVSDSNGVVKFLMVRPPSVNQLILQTDFKTDSGFRFVKSEPFSTQYTYTPLPDSIAAMTEHLQNEQQAWKAFYGKADKVYLLDDYTRFPTLEEVLREYVMEVKVRKSAERFMFSVQNIPHGNYFEGEPLVLLDGLPVFDLNALMALDPLQIRRLEVVARKFHAGSLVCNGVVSFTTYTGQLGGYPLHADALVTEWNTH